MIKFNEMPYQRPNMEAIALLFKSLIKQFKEASSLNQAIEAMFQINDINIDYTTAGSIANARHSINTADIFYDQEKDFFDENDPHLSILINEFYKVLLESKFKKELELRFGKFYFDRARLSTKTTSEAVSDLKKIENKFCSDYYKLTASAKIEFRGESYNLAGMAPYLQSADRSTRKEAASTLTGWWVENSSTLDTLYTNLIRTRHEIAIKLGYENFIELGYDLHNRIDYRAPEVEKFRQIILERVVPLSNQIRSKQANRLDLNSLQQYDLMCFFNTGNPTPKGTSEEVIDIATTMYKELSPETDIFFQMMKKYELMDLVNKKDKRGGGYCTSFVKYKSPFIFSNFNGTSHDAVVLTHEAGHAFQSFESGHLPLLEMRWPNKETCEIHSMGMEFLTYPWMKILFKEDTDKYLYQHLCNAILFLPFGAAVDEFQHLMYARPTMTSAERNEAWKIIDKKYRPCIDYTDIPEVNDGRLWQRVMHIYCLPFYFIDYCLAQICSFQIWSRDRKDHVSTWADYLKLCQAGGTKPFLEIIQEVNINSPFDPDTVDATMQELRIYLEAIEDTKL